MPSCLFVSERYPILCRWCNLQQLVLGFDFARSVISFFSLNTFINNNIQNIPSTRTSYKTK